MVETDAYFLDASLIRSIPRSWPITANGERRRNPKLPINSLL
jgi:hypothetical protein